MAMVVVWWCGRGSGVVSIVVVWWCGRGVFKAVVVCLLNATTTTMTTGGVTAHVSPLHLCKN